MSWHLAHKHTRARARRCPRSHKTHTHEGIRANSAPARSPRRSPRRSPARVALSRDRAPAQIARHRRRHSDRARVARPILSSMGSAGHLRSCRARMSRRETRWPGGRREGARDARRAAPARRRRGIRRRRARTSAAVAHLRCSARRPVVSLRARDARPRFAQKRRRHIKADATSAKGRHHVVQSHHMVATTRMCSRRGERPPHHGRMGRHGRWPRCISVAPWSTAPAATWGAPMANRPDGSARRAPTTQTRRRGSAPAR